MAFVLADRVQETSTTTGTGTLTLAGAVTGYASFASIGNGNNCYYTITDGTNWEVGIGTYTAAGTTLSRTTVLASSNAGSLVTFPAGTKNVFCNYPAGKAVYLDTSGNVSALGTIASGTWNGTTIAIANGGTGATSAAAALTNLGAYAASNPSGYTSNTGTVTSVSGTGTVSGLTLSGTVTTTGSLTLGGTLAVTASNFASQTANTFLAAPNGTAGVPTFRAIAAADVPTLNQNTTGTASNITGVVAIANGGTGQTTRQNAMDALAGATTSGQYLRGNGTDVVMSAIQAADVPTLNQNTTGSSGSCTGNAATATTATTANALNTANAYTVAGITSTAGFTATSAAPFHLNATTVSANYTSPANYNLMSAGPITINTGVTVTIDTTGTWVIV